MHWGMDWRMSWRMDCGCRLCCRPRPTLLGQRLFRSRPLLLLLLLLLLRVLLLVHLRLPCALLQLVRCHVLLVLGYDLPQQGVVPRVSGMRDLPCLVVVGPVHVGQELTVTCVQHRVPALPDDGHRGVG